MANFVETEQLVELSGSGGGLVSSFVQIRGSIPLLWSQVPNIKYKPTTRLAPKSAYQPAFDSHIASIVQIYKVILQLYVSFYSLKSTKSFRVWILLECICIQGSNFSICDFAPMLNSGRSSEQSLAQFDGSLGDCCDFIRESIAVGKRWLLS